MRLSIASAEIENGVTIEPGAIIGSNVSIGSGTVIAANVVIGNGCKIGRDCYVAPNSFDTICILGQSRPAASGCKDWPGWLWLCAWQGRAG